MELPFVVYSNLKQCWSVGHVSVLNLSFIVTVALNNRRAFSPHAEGREFETRTRSTDLIKPLQQVLTVPLPNTWQEVWISYGSHMGPFTYGGNVFIIEQTCVHFTHKGTPSFPVIGCKISAYARRFWHLSQEDLYNTKHTATVTSVFRASSKVPPHISVYWKWKMLSIL